MRTLVAFTFDYQNAHPEFPRLVMNENILDGRYLARSKVIRRLNTTVIDALRALLQRGVRAGVFRRDIDPIELHMSISALCFFNVANRATFSPDLQTRHGLAQGARAAARPGRRHHPATRQPLTGRPAGGAD